MQDSLARSKIFPALMRTAIVEGAFFVVFWFSGSFEQWKLMGAQLFIMTLCLYLYGASTGVDDRLIWPMLVLERMGVYIKVSVWGNDAKDTLQILIYSYGACFVVMAFGPKLVKLIDRGVTVWLILSALGTFGLYGLLLVMGSEINGARAWIVIGGQSIQMTELIKFVSCIFYALCFSLPWWTWKSKVLRVLLHPMILATAFTGICCLFLILFNELGTLLVILMVYLVLCLCHSIKLTIPIAAAGGGVGFVGWTVLSKIAETNARAYDIAHKIAIRFDAVYHPERLDQFGEGYQAMAARKALAVCGWTGRITNVWIPNMQEDFAYLAMLMAGGLVAGIFYVLIFTLYVVIAVWQVMRPNTSIVHGNLSRAFVTSIVIQAFLTIGGSTLFIPLTGIPLPFISTGGTYSLILYAMIGFLFIKPSIMEVETQECLNNNSSWGGIEQDYARRTNVRSARKKKKSQA